MMTLDEYRRTLPARRRRLRKQQLLSRRKQARFRRKFEGLLRGDGINPTVLSIPGAYEPILKEYYSVVLEALEHEPMKEEA